jgi:hypothetical protein
VIPVKDLFDKIAARRFEPADAKEFVKSSYYFANTHPDVHIVLSVRRPADFHFQHLPQYEERSLHSMFQSMDDAAAGIAGALNCKAGESALRFLSVSGVNRATILSRSGAQAAQTMMVRSAIASMGARSGTMYGTESTAIVTVVLSIHSGEIVLTTAYPAHLLPQNRPVPPEGSDLVEFGNQRFVYASS